MDAERKGVDAAVGLLMALGVPAERMAIVAATFIWQWSALRVDGEPMHRWRWKFEGYTMRLETEWVGGCKEQS